MTKRWIPPKADASRVRRARKAQALRARRRGKVLIVQEASLRAGEGIEALRRELDQKVPNERRARTDKSV